MNPTTAIKRIEGGYQLGKLAAIGLAPRESQALLLRANGFSSEACAQAMNCKTGNVQARIRNLFYKMHATTTPELITKCFGSGILRFLSLVIALHIGMAAPGDYRFARVSIRVAGRPVHTQQKAA